MKRFLFLVLFITGYVTYTSYDSITKSLSFFERNENFIYEVRAVQKKLAHEFFSEVAAKIHQVEDLLETPRGSSSEWLDGKNHRVDDIRFLSRNDLDLAISNAKYALARAHMVSAIISNHKAELMAIPAKERSRAVLNWQDKYWSEAKEVAAKHAVPFDEILAEIRAAQNSEGLDAIDLKKLEHRKIRQESEVLASSAKTSTPSDSSQILATSIGMPTP